MDDTGAVTLTDERGTFERALNLETLRSERRRVAFTAVLLVLLLGVLTVVQLCPALMRPELQPKLDQAFWPLSGLCLALTAYEVVVWVWLGRRVKENRRLTAGFRYVNAFIETSFPTVALVALAAIAGPIQPLVGATSMVYFPFILLRTLDLGFRLCAFAGAVAAVEFGVASLVMLSLATADGPALPEGWAIVVSPHQYVTKGVLMFATGLLAGFVAWQIRRQVRTALHTVAERDRAISIFGQHVSPQVAELLLKQRLDLAGEERNVCVMFLDIRDFSRLAAERSPAEVMAYLNTLFGAMIASVNRHRGIVNKFLGDGFMAVFGAPVDDAHQCHHAIDAAREILSHVEQLNRAGTIPATRVGIGLHLGRAMTGHVGSAERKEYTIIGDVVNLASRIEQATKTHDARLLVSEAVWQFVDARQCPGEDLGLVELKGQPGPVRLFRLA